MLTRRNLFRLVAAMIAYLPMGFERFASGKPLRIADAHKLTQSALDKPIEMWMNEWMSLSKAPGGMLRISRFREPIYFLTDSISWTPNIGQEAFGAVSVPSGFVTDFASIPRIFYSILRPDGEYAYSAVFHYYLYWTKTRSRK